MSGSRARASKAGAYNLIYLYIRKILAVELTCDN